MTAITTRAGKGSPLTAAEHDSNLNNLNDAKREMIKAATASPPANPKVGWDWLDTDTGLVYTWTGFEWAELDSGAVIGITATKTVTIEAPTASENITFFYTTEALTIASVRTVVKGSSPSVTYSIKSAADRSSGSPTTHVNASVANNTTTGATATIADTVIPSGRWVWLETSALSGTVDSINFTMSFS
jgi:hypothetical protein